MATASGSDGERAPRPQPMWRDTFVIVVHALAFDATGRLLLLRRANTGVMDGLCAPPGGHRQPNERLLDAAIREAREEACIDIAAAHPIAALPFDTGVNFLFQATEWHGTPRIGEPHKCDHLTFEASTALPPNTVPWLPRALELQNQALWYHDFT